MRARTGLLLAALAAVVAAGLVPDHPLSVHMVQHGLLSLVAAPLLAAAGPVRILLGALGPTGRRRVGTALNSRSARVIGSPVGSLVLFSGTVLAVHLTGFFDAAERHPAVHALEHALLLLTPLPLWELVLGADPLPHRPGPLGRIALVLLAMPAMSLVGVVLASGSHVRYAADAGPGALADQHTAGAFMWVGGTALETLVLLVAAGLALAAEERRQRRRDLHADRIAAGARP